MSTFNPGVYYFEREDILVIAWEVYQKNVEPISSVNPSIPWGTYGTVEVYQECGVAVEGPHITILLQFHDFMNEFTYIGPLK